MNPVELIKLATTGVVAIGAGAIIKNTVRATIDPSATKSFQRAAITIGGFFLARAVGDFAAKNATESIDSLVETFTSVKKVTTDAVKTAQATVKELSDEES
jgi:hypothetical protein